MSEKQPGGGPAAPPNTPIKTPIKAATVVLARDVSPGGVEVFLVERHPRMGFMGGVHVFPGGKLSTADSSERMRARTVGGDAHGGVWGDAIGDTLATGLAVAAIRETFEEAGVLISDRDPGSLHLLRARLLEGAGFAELLEAAGTRLRLSALTPLARWITPDAEPRRYDTHFYVARVPDAQRATHDDGETVSGSWYRPGEALAACAAGALRLAPPTRRTLLELEPHPSVGTLRACARARVPPLIEPIIRREGSKAILVFPGDPLHHVSQRLVAGPTREELPT